MSDYDSSFYDENIRVGLAAAEVIVPWVINRTGAHTVIDVGCGSATFASVAKECGCVVTGVDWNVPESHLLIDQSEFQRVNLTDGISCDGYDLAICLEVGEHIPESSAEYLVAGLCEARYVLWSAAIPGQNGVNHITERWQSWWSPWFDKCGYVGSSDIRHVFWDDSRIAPFYRQNLALYTKPGDLRGLRMNVGVVDEVHPENPHIPPCSA